MTPKSVLSKVLDRVQTIAAETEGALEAMQAGGHALAQVAESDEEVKT